jgi:NAD(P) transhydrogenase subunit beta
VNASFLYIVAALLFIRGIKLLGKVHTARLGNIISSVGMIVAIFATITEFPLQNITLTFVVALLGAYVGLWMAIRVPMTAMPEMVALFNGFGGLASVFIGMVEGIKLSQFPAEYFDFSLQFSQVAVCLTVFIGGITFTGSLLAYGKLSQKISSASICFCGQKYYNIGLGILSTIAGWYWLTSHCTTTFYGLIILSLGGGILFLLHIGGGDMPVIIALLNSLSGVAACTAGLIILNKVLIVAGCLVGMSGIILTLIMCKSMNRSLKKVLLGSFQIKHAQSLQREDVEPKTTSIADAYYILESARTVAFVPGYGMAVAQAQHAVKDLAQRLQANGTEVFYAIHPVAGRMPGHMNVLLAEADVDYDQLIELESANERMGNTDVAIVIGANDVVNPAAVEKVGSPIYGMPIIEVFKAKTVFVLKRGKGKGFSGLENALFTKENTWMIYGDAKATLMQWVAEFKSVDE